MMYLSDIQSEVTTWCNHDPTPEPEVITEIQYGALYNWYAVVDVRNICSIGWHVPTVAEFLTLANYLGGIAIAGKELKEIGVTYWDAFNTGTNSTGFNGRGSGKRYEDGSFSLMKDAAFFWNADIGDPDASYYSGLYTEFDIFETTDFGIGDLYLDYIVCGLGIRPIKDSTTLSDGETGTYTGNDGKIYRTICIGTQEWVADNLFETKFRNGDNITVVTDAGTWIALATEGMCYYNNDILNA